MYIKVISEGKKCVKNLFYLDNYFDNFFFERKYVFSIKFICYNDEKKFKIIYTYIYIYTLYTLTCTYILLLQQVIKQT